MKPVYHALIVAVAAIAVYLNALSNGFVFDDNFQVLGNEWIKDPANLPRFFLTGVWAFMDDTPLNYYRPMMNVMYMLCYQFFGLGAFGFHLLNIVLHSGVSVLVFLLARRLTAAHAASTSLAAMAPLAAGVLFAAHPIHSEAVTWVAAVPDLSYTFFGLLSLMLYVDSRESEYLKDPRYLGSVAAFLLALFCKEPALVFLAVFPAYDFACGRRGLGVREIFMRAAPFALAAALYMVFRFNAISGIVPFNKDMGMGPYALALNALSFFGWYMVKLVLPFNLNIYHILHPVRSAWGAVPMLSLLLVFALAFAMRVAYRKDGTAFLGLCLVALPVLPVLYIPALSENAFGERYLYLPSAGLFLALCALASRIKAPRPVSIAALGTACAVLALFSAGTIARNAVLKNNITLWEDSVLKSPDGVMPHNNLGIEYEKAGRHDEAIREFEMATKVRPDYDGAYCNLGIACLNGGNAGRAVEVLRVAVGLKPGNKYYHENLGLAYSGLGRYDAAVEELAAAARLDPSNGTYRANLWDAIKKRAGG